jgi:tRNA-Thr(GGU) m(6)t(6)A37 methyltransferase TsaA
MATNLKASKNTIAMEPIGVVQTVFKDKFGIPRQPGLAPTLTGTLKLNDNADLKRGLYRIEEFSHLWVVFIFHQTGSEGWKPSVRPPRLGGKEKVGVFASRSPHRPNPIGLSVVKIEKINLEAVGGPEIEISGVDILDGSPILDIKPYVEFCDRLEGTNSGWATNAPVHFPVRLSQKARELLPVMANQTGVGEKLEGLILDLVKNDPRPSNQKRKWPPGAKVSEGKQFGILIYGWDVRFVIEGDDFVITELVEGYVKKPKT